MTKTLHNPDRYMADLRQILSQGRKRIGVLVGAGAPTALRIDANGHVVENGEALIPDVAGLTLAVLGALDPSDQKIIDELSKEIGGNPNIETLLTKVRKLAKAIGNAQVRGLDGPAYDALGLRICEKIGGMVCPHLPTEPNPYSELVAWISGTYREHPIEIFTPNYDLLMEEAFERARVAYFDGFSGAHKPFFDPVGISSSEQLPSRWARLWKIHGSLGWDIESGTVIRTGQRNATELIYPDHLKYDEITRLPYSALFERLRTFLTTPDTLLVTTGFSFFDSHICAVLDEALAANAHSAVFAFQYRNLSDEGPATKLALSRPNLSVYARDGAVINGIPGQWQPGELPNDEWKDIRQTFWRHNTEQGHPEFLLGDFAKLARFFALAHAQQMLPGGSAVSSPSSDLTPESVPPHEGANAKS